MSHSTPKGCIFALQTFSLHNGPGIRTTIFLKGCPLRCIWCANPESQNSFPELMYNRTLCLPDCTLYSSTGVNASVKKDKEGKVLIPQRARTSDFFLHEAPLKCPTDALSVAGKTVSVEEIFDELIKDKPFFEESGGGVTLSGGEPLFQPEFTLSLLEKLKDHRVHSAVDTCGDGAWDVMQEVCRTASLLLFDIKTAVPATHKKYTGKTNSVILNNLQTAMGKYRTKIRIRIPLIPEINTTDDELNAMIRLFSDLNISQVDLLPHHTLGTEKYGHLGRRNPGDAIPAADSETVDRAVTLLQKASIEVNVI